jgi:hypothetical protein
MNDTTSVIFPKINQLNLVSESGNISCFDPEKKQLIFDAQKRIQISFVNQKTIDALSKMQTYIYRFEGQDVVDVTIYSMDPIATSSLMLQLREQLDAL